MVLIIIGSKLLILLLLLLFAIPELILTEYGIYIYNTITIIAIIVIVAVIAIISVVMDTHIDCHHLIITILPITNNNTHTYTLNIKNINSDGQPELEKFGLVKEIGIM